MKKKFVGRGGKVNYNFEIVPARIYIISITNVFHFRDAIWQLKI